MSVGSKHGAEVTQRPTFPSCSAHRIEVDRKKSFGLAKAARAPEWQVLRRIGIIKIVLPSPDRSRALVPREKTQTEPRSGTLFGPRLEECSEPTPRCHGMRLI
ncbi:hypothetical protein AVEN_200543-1 [Araneus ventricosus]|uniref:Uncharacterized protein n=1 Tax=Araneus ventricosus TaxID=182803 RepID=A0A4Y2U0D0_ARAVE|nr:hypothetical protein AVEN_200543-1 [Araneus ventricosus]